MVVTASIVLFRTPPFLIKRLLDCLSVADVCDQIYLIDNSPEEIEFPFSQYKDVVYIKSNNIGYGAGHNIAIRRCIPLSNFHFVLNPDIFFGEKELTVMLERIQSDDSIGLLMPKILSPDNTVQYLCKLIPTPMDLFLRRFPLPVFRNQIDSRNHKYELRFTGYDSEMNAPTLSGCFMLLNMSALKLVGIFDERFFMYAEDVDLTRRLHYKFKTIYFPYAVVFHDHAKDSYKNLRMLFMHIFSVIKYFNKWGWIRDGKREVLNRRFLTSFNLDDVKR
jgi:GT2 family glycosyltransferase